MVNIDADHRLDHILHAGDTIQAGDSLYTITGDPIGFGGSSILYPANRSGSELLYAIKECFPGTPVGSFARINGIIRPKSPEDAEAVGTLMHFRNRMETERIIGQRISNTNARAIGIWEVLEPSAIKVDGREYTDVSESIFAVLERMDTKGMTFRQLLEDIAQSKAKDHPLRTGSLPKIYTTACMMEQVLLAVQRVHKAGYLFGDIQDGNVFFSDCHPETGDIGIGNLLDFGCARELIDGKRTAPITDTCFTTRGFIPPELLDPNKNDGSLTLGPEADIYSVGCLMLRCLVSKYKIRAMGDSPAIGSNTIDGQEARKLGCSESIRKTLNSILRQAMAREPEDRYPSAEAMLEDIRNLKRDTRPPEYLLPPAPGSSESFVEHSRDREIGELTRALEQNEPVFLWGLGGIGKTETAIQVAKNWNSPKGAYFVHYTIPNDDNWESMEETVLQMPFTDYHFDPKKKGLSREQLRVHEYRERMDILRKQYTGALLIIDNFDHPNKTLDDLRSEKSFRELTNMGIKILFTTRYPVDWASQWELCELKEDDLLKLMRRYCTDHAVPDEHLKQLIAAVNGHTLTVELIAKTLSRSRRKISPEQMLESLRSSNLSGINGPDVRSDQNREIRIAQIHEHLRSLFNLSGLDEEAKKILCCATLLPAGGMDCVLFEDSLENRPEKTMTYILDCGWLRNSSDNLLTIHPVIREVCREELKPDKETCGGFLEILLNRYDHDDPKAAINLLLADCFATAADSIADDEAYFASTAGELYLHAEIYADALKYYEQTLSIRQPVLSENSPELEELYRILGRICFMLKMMADYHLSLIEDEDPELAKFHNHIKSIHLKLKRIADYGITGLTEESPLLNTIYELGKQSPVVEYSRKSIHYYMQALFIEFEDIDNYWQKIISSATYLKWLHYELEEYEDAKNCAELAVEGQKAIYPSDKKTLAECYRFLGDICWKMKNQPEAEKHYKEALRIQKRVLPANHPDIAHTYLCMTLLYKESNPRKSDKYMNLWYEIQKQKESPKVPLWKKLLPRKYRK